MATATRRLALSKRVSLAHLFGNNEQCYAMVRPATRAEYKLMTSEKMTSLDGPKQVEEQNKFVMSHFISGKIMVLGEDEKPVLADMEAADVEDQISLSNALYIAIMGFNLDPKDL